MFKFCIVLAAVLFTASSGVPRLYSFADLGKYHCNAIDLKLLYQIASGNLA